MNGGSDAQRAQDCVFLFILLKTYSARVSPSSDVKAVTQTLSHLLAVI